MADLKDTATHVTGLRGKLSEATSDPADQGVAGVRTGEMYYDTALDSVKIKGSSQWRGVQLTTSTSTSTTTTSTSTTTTSTSTSTTTS